MTETVIITADEISLEESEELLDHAEETITGLVLATAAYFKSHNTPFSDWSTFVGTKVAPTWDVLKGSNVSDVVKVLALNLLAGGAEILSVTGNANTGEIKIAWPSQEDLDYLKLSREDVDPFFDWYKPVAKELGLTYSCKREGEKYTLTFSR